MTKFLQGDSEGTGFLGVVEESCKFGFGCRGNNLFQDMTGDMDGTIQDWIGLDLVDRYKYPAALDLALETDR